MRNVALNGKRSFLICIHSAEDRFSESANKRMQSNRQTATHFVDRWREASRPLMTPTHQRDQKHLKSCDTIYSEYYDQDKQKTPGISNDPGATK